MIQLYRFAPRRASRSFHAVSLAVLAIALAPATAKAVVTSGGNVNPSPNPGNPGGGAIVGPLFVGDSTSGQVTMTAGSTLTLSSGSIFVGNGANALGLIILQDFGTSLTASTASADLTIGSSGAGTVSVTAQAQVRIGDDLSLGVNAGASGTLNMNGFGSLVDVGNDALIGGAGDGSVIVNNGARVVADASTIGHINGSDGRITVSGLDSLWRQTGAMTIGDAGVGDVQIGSQGRVETGAVAVGNGATGIGVMVVSGASSVWQANGALTLGSAGKATLNVIDGGRLTTTLTTRLAVLDGSEAHALITGASALWNAGTAMIVGEMGFATLDVRNGARVVTGNVQIGDNVGARGEVVVEGRGSVLTINGTLDVSDPGEGDLTIANSGLVTTTGVARIAAAGRLSLVGGRLEVGGATGLTNNGLIQGGGRIFGAVTNTATGKVRTRLGEVLVLGNTLTNAGIVEMDGGELETVGALTNNGDFDVQSAILRTGGAGFDNNSGAQLAIVGGQVDVFGNVDNNDDAQIVVGANSTAVFHDELDNSGQFFLFEDSSVVVLDDLAFTPTSILGVQIGQDEDELPEFATMESAGQAALNGALNVTLTLGFLPSAGDSFQLLTAAGGVSGAFASTALPSLGGGLTWDLDYNADNVLLRVVAGLTADFNGDGSVNSADLTAWRANFGKVTGAIQAEGDADGDGNVDGSDFLTWQRQVTAPSLAPATAQVPEPASWALLGLAGVLGATWRRRSATN